MYKFIKKYKLILIPLSMYLALTLLLGVCAIYTHGNWFFVATFSVLLGLIIIFSPIYIAKYNIFAKVRKYNDFISIGIDFIALNLLLIVINIFTYTINYTNAIWYTNLALPITFVI